MPAPTTAVETQLVEYLQEAHAMEEDTSQMLSSMIETTNDPEIRQILEHHREETGRQSERLERCLESYEATPSRTKDLAASTGAAMKGLIDSVRSEKPGKNARDGFATEALEIASYELLERWADRAGDETVAEVARENRAEEEAMAKKIASNWDRFVDRTIEEEGLA